MSFGSGSLSILGDVSKWCPLWLQCHHLPQETICLSLSNSFGMINGGFYGNLAHATSEQGWSSHRLVKENLFNSENAIRIGPSEKFPFRNINFFSLFEAESLCIFWRRNEYIDFLGDSLV